MAPKLANLNPINNTLEFLARLYLALKKDAEMLQKITWKMMMGIFLQSYQKCSTLKVSSGQLEVEVSWGG